jgi:exopolysaccharide production protein ExoQ
MPPPIASSICALLIFGLFWLDRDQRARTSAGLWIPVLWLGLACSRAPSEWLQVGTPLAAADQVLEGSPTDRLVYSILLAAGMLVLARRGRVAGRILRANGPILFFFLYCAATFVWSDFPDVAFKRWNKAVGDLVMVLIVLSDRDPLSAIKTLQARLAYVLIPLSILFIKYYPTLGVGYSLWGGSKAVYMGVTTNKNTLGVICLLLGLGALWRILARTGQRVTTNRRQLIAQLLVLAMVIWLFNIIDARTSLSSFLMASILLVLTSSRSAFRRPFMVHLLIGLMLTVSASVVFLGASPSTLQMMGRNPTLTDRTEVWGVLISLVSNPWLGTGFESFWLGSRLEKMWSLYWWHPNQAHNGYLETYLNLGWVGIILLGIVLAVGYRSAFRCWRKVPSIGNLRLALFFVGLVFNFTEAAFFRMQSPAWLFFLIAIITVPELRVAPGVSGTPAHCLIHDGEGEDADSRQELIKRRARNYVS